MEKKEKIKEDLIKGLSKSRLPIDFNIKEEREKHNKKIKSQLGRL